MVPTKENISIFVCGKNLKVKVKTSSLNKKLPPRFYKSNETRR